MASILLPMVASSMQANSFWMSMASLAGGLIDQSLFATNVNQTSGKVSDLQMQTSSLGANIVKGWGKARLAGNIIWGTKFVEHKTSSKQGGKGGGGSVTTTSYSYSVSFCVQICEGPIVGISNVWADGNDLDLSTLDCTLYLGTESQGVDPFMEGIEGEGNVPAYRGTAYLVVKNMDLSPYGNRIPTLSFVVQFPSNNVAQIVSDISEDAGVDLNSLDVTDLTSLAVEGFTVSGSKTFRSQIEELQMVKVFDGIEIDGKVIFKRRSFDNVISISEEEMGAYESSKPEEAVQSTRKYDIELPRAIKLNYPSSDNDYQTGVAPAFRQLTKSVTETSLTTNVVMSDSEARVVAETRLYELWMNRTTHEITVSNKYAFVRPSDILEFVLPNVTKLVIVLKTSYGTPGLSKISAADINAITYKTTNRYVDPGVTKTTDPATAITTYFLDVPRLPTDTTTTDTNMYVVCSAKTFYGANIFKSIDNGVTWTYFSQILSNATIGSCSNALSDGITHQWDMANTVTVVLTNGTLENRPEVDVLNGYNAAMIGEEIIQYKTATLIAPDTYVLSELLRGRNGTEHKTNTHIVGEKFIALDISTVNPLTIATSEWYKGLLFRVGPKNVPVTDEAYQDYTVTSQAVIALPWNVCQVSATRSNGDLTLNWTRRTRGDGTWKDYAEVPLTETSERYEIDILSDEVVKRTLTSTTPTVLYSSANQIVDFGSNPSSIKVRIYQMSETRGRGIVKEVNV